jgi:hypothetical protein
VQAFNGFSISDGRIYVLTKIGKERIEGRTMLTSFRDQTSNTVYMPLSNIGNRGRPLFPIPLIPHLLDHAGIDD